MYLDEVIGLLETAYPPVLAESWDAVGLVAGDPAAEVNRVLVTVDVTADVVDRAIADGADLIIAHHPLLLRGVTSVAANSNKGELLHRMIRSGIALYTAHTNADRAVGGVNDALAARLGLTVTAALEPADDAGLDKWVVTVPGPDADAVLAALFAAGAGRVGNYRDCAFRTEGTGQFTPGLGATPTIGEVGAPSTVAEVQLQLVADPALREKVRAALHAAHPYETPAYDLHSSAVPTNSPLLGAGRVGTLEAPITLGEFADRVAERLGAPVRVAAAGDRERIVQTVAVCGGAGDSFLPLVRRAGVDVYVTADLRHHVVDEHLRARGPAVIDAGHWATEFPWCQTVVDLLAGHGLPGGVFELSTDPFLQ